MKRDAVGRVSYTEQQREAMLDEFERSGLKGAQFALAAGVKYQTFAHWLQQRRHARGGYATAGRAAERAPALRLVEAVVAGVPAVAATGRPSAAMVAGPLEVHLPCGSKLLVASTAQVELAAQLLKALHTSC